MKLLFALWVVGLMSPAWAGPKERKAAVGRVVDSDLARILTRWDRCSGCDEEIYAGWAVQARTLADELVGLDAVDALAASWSLEIRSERRSDCWKSGAGPVPPHELFDLMLSDGGKGLWLRSHVALHRNRIAIEIVPSRDAVQTALDNYGAIETAENADGTVQVSFPRPDGEFGRTAVDPELMHEVSRYVRFVEEELLPAAHSGPNVAPKCYRMKARRVLGEDIDPHALHAQALAQLQANRAATVQQAGQTLGIDGWEAVRSSLMAHTYASADEALAIAGEAVADSRPLVGSLADGLSDCHVGPGKDWAGLYFTATDDSPAVWTVDIFAPETTPVVLSRLIGSHECWPGHHVEYSVVAEPALPRFRRDLDVRAFTEGWATYAENVPVEHGYLRGPEEQLAPLLMDAWRTTRVLVDTGVHAEGWTVEEAEEAFREWTILPQHQIDRETASVLSRPGWLLGHKLGGDEIRALRAEAERELGEAFDADDFHALLLSEGDLPLPALRRLVREWIAGNIETPTL